MFRYVLHWCLWVGVGGGVGVEGGDLGDGAMLREIVDCYGRLWNFTVEDGVCVCGCGVCVGGVKCMIPSWVRLDRLMDR